MGQAGASPLVILSGGQTGVDRGALDAALEIGVECGGWCPDGRTAEDVRIPDRYPLVELECAGYAELTRCLASSAAKNLRRTSSYSPRLS